MFTFIFVGFLLATVLVRWYLSVRHVRHIAQHSQQVPSAFAEKITLSSHQKSAAYSIAKQRFSISKAVFDAMVVVVLTLLGVVQILQLWITDYSILILSHIDPNQANAFENLLIAFLTSSYWQLVLLILAVMMIVALLDLPFQLWYQFKLEAYFGFNTMTIRLFIKDMLIGTLLSGAFFIPLLLAVIWFIDIAPSSWWLLTWIAFCGFNVLMLFIYPKWIAPLFNRFTPLTDSGLKERIQQLAERCGFHIQDLYVMDGSKRSAHGNAYFTGLGKNKRIVFFDTLLEKLSPDEIEAVLAHELGHFHHKHILKRIISSFFIALVILAGIAYLVEQPWFYIGLGYHPNLLSAHYPVIGLLLFSIIAPYFSFFLTPISSKLSRRHEFEADAYAAKNSNPAHLVQALVKLYNDNAATLTPDPMYSAFYDSHPPASIRIAQLQQAGNHG